jgi:uncharacterized protein YdeI (YjbR/CyaY-like superfamily)
MQITKTLYVIERDEWRAWLAKHHDTEKDIWLIYYKKQSGEPRIPYNDAVEEALCFGWIDSIVKGIDENKYAQRFSPRKKGSNWSEMNRVRMRRLIEQGTMTPAGLSKFEGDAGDSFEIPSDIIEALKQDKKTWTTFEGFPESYKRIRIGFIEMARSRPDIFQQRLRYFLKLTSQGKRFGMVQ